MTQFGERGQSVWMWMTNRESGRRPSQCAGGNDGGRCVERIHGTLEATRRAVPSFKHH